MPAADALREGCSLSSLPGVWELSLEGVKLETFSILNLRLFKPDCKQATCFISVTLGLIGPHRLFHI